MNIVVEQEEEPSSSGGQKVYNCFFVSVDYIKGCTETVGKNGSIAGVKMKE